MAKKPTKATPTPAATPKPKAETKAPAKKVDPKENVVRKMPQDPELIEVKTTGKFGLTDPITGIDISHEGTTKVPKDSSFIITMLKRKRIKEV